MTRRLGAILAVSMLIVGCAPTAPTPAPTSGSAPPVVASGLPEAPGDPATTVRAGDVSMTVRVVTPRVPVGGVVEIAVTIQNDRPTDVEHTVQCDASVTATVRLPIPHQPEGRAWDGIAGEFKTYALRQGMGPGGVAALDPATVHAPAYPCQGFQGESTLEAGGTIAATLLLRTEIVDGVSAAPGTYELEVLFLYDRHSPFDGMVTYEQLALKADFAVEGAVPPVLTAGQAVDAMLGEPRFATWLSQMPSRTWSIANLFLEHGDGQGDVVPKGASWSVELFRELGVPRNWAIGHVDPFSGALLTLAFCNNPCDR